MLFLNIMRECFLKRVDTFRELAGKLFEFEYFTTQMFEKIKLGPPFSLSHICLFMLVFFKHDDFLEFFYIMECSVVSNN